MKKTAALILCLICVLFCFMTVGCSSDKGSSSDSNSSGMNSSEPSTQAPTQHNNGTVTDGDGFIGNEGNENNDTQTPTMSQDSGEARNMFDNVL